MICVRGWASRWNGSAPPIGKTKSSKRTARRWPGSAGRLPPPSELRRALDELVVDGLVDFGSLTSRHQQQVDPAGGRQRRAAAAVTPPERVDRDRLATRANVRTRGGGERGRRSPRLFAGGLRPATDRPVSRRRRQPPHGQRATV